MDALFKNRTDAGRKLADALRRNGAKHPIVLALPRGGVPVASEVARELRAPIDLIIVRKIGAPWQPELAVGAIADSEPPEIVRNETIIEELGVDEQAIAREAAEQQREIARRRAVYLKNRAPLPLSGRTAIVVDDGIATGATMRAALLAVKRRGAARIVLAVPVAAAEALEELRPLVDTIVCLTTPEPFHAIGAHYADFHQVSDGEVTAAMAGATEIDSTAPR